MQGGTICLNYNSGAVCQFHGLIVQLFPDIAYMLFDLPNEPFEIQRRIKVNQEAAGDYVSSGLMDPWQRRHQRF
jgi:hypothetical protein